jgi:hypothetical protein
MHRRVGIGERLLDPEQHLAGLAHNPVALNALDHHVIGRQERLEPPAGADG